MTEPAQQPADGSIANSAWWKGRRGEWFVVIQGLLIVVVAVGPRTWRGWPARPFPDGRIVSACAAALILAATVLFLGAVRSMGRRLTALPYPVENSTLVETGPFRFVRHPIYSGVMFASFGWALLVQGWLTLVYAAVLTVFLDVKARREERWLEERFPAYADYRRRVRRLVPFVY
jgi:protein-S-isoprenylcysteine O-methyltransferase Ste14